MFFIVIRERSMFGSLTYRINLYRDYKFVQ